VNVGGEDLVGVVVGVGVTFGVVGSAVVTNFLVVGAVVGIGVLATFGVVGVTLFGVVGAGVTIIGGGFGLSPSESEGSIVSESGPSL